MGLDNSRIGSPGHPPFTLNNPIKPEALIQVRGGWKDGWQRRDRLSNIEREESRNLNKGSAGIFAIDARIVFTPPLENKVKTAIV